jgi:hypothetical protein
LFLLLVWLDDSGIADEIRRTERVEHIEGSDIDLNQYVNRRVSFKGTACNAKLGAALQTEFHVVYIDEMESWPRNVIGKTIFVLGLLVKKEGSTLKEGEVVKSGIQGPYFILNEAEWEVLK